MEAAATFLNKATKPVLVAGVKLRPSHAEESFLKLADASGTAPFFRAPASTQWCQQAMEDLMTALAAVGYPVAIQPNAKGMFPEHHERFIGASSNFASCRKVCSVKL